MEFWVGKFLGGNYSLEWHKTPTPNLAHCLSYASQFTRIYAHCEEFCINSVHTVRGEKLMELHRGGVEMGMDVKVDAGNWGKIITMLEKYQLSYNTVVVLNFAH